MRSSANRLDLAGSLVVGLSRADPDGLIANVLIANCPQLILSILFIFYNAMLSTFLVQREFSLMYARRKTLRVSEPVGIQRSSYFISLPLRYGLPLYIIGGHHALACLAEPVSGAH